MTKMDEMDKHGVKRKGKRSKKRRTKMPNN